MGTKVEPHSSVRAIDVGDWRISVGDRVVRRSDDRKFVVYKIAIGQVPFGRRIVVVGIGQTLIVEVNDFVLMFREIE